MSLIGWKNMFVLWGSFQIFQGEKFFAVLPYGGIKERKFTPVLLQEWYEYFLVQI